MTFTLTQEQYEALVAMARAAVLDKPDRLRAVDAFLRAIEKANGVTRSIVWVQWQEQDAPLPPGTLFPQKWPPEMRQKIELVSRPVARADVDALLLAKARNPTSVLVTRDPAGVLGYTSLDNFFSN